MAAYALITCFLDLLVRNGALLPEQQDEIYEEGLLLLEQLQGSASASQAQTIQRARGLLEARLHAVAQRLALPDQDD